MLTLKSRGVVRAALALPALFAIGSCGGGGSSYGGGSASPTTCPANIYSRQFVINSISLPTSAAAFAADLNGDSISDNRYGSIVAAFAQQNIDSQAVINQLVSSGGEIVLVQQGSSDLNFQADTCAGAIVQAGIATLSPDFTGNGTFTVNASVPAVQFGGTLTSGVFSAQDQAPSKTTGVPIKLPIGSELVRVTLVAGRIKYTVGAGGLTSGTVNGAILGSDIPGVLNAAAASMQGKITADPTSTLSQQLLALFDTGGAPAGGACPTSCQNADTSCAVSGDGKVDACEFSTNTIVKNIFAPDVQLFDPATGSYSPNPGNTSKDSLSVGFGFTAVNASF